MEGVLRGWDEIGTYLGCDARTAQHYEQERFLPVHRRPTGGPKARVFALKSELDKWLDIDESEAQAKGADRGSTRSGELASSVLSRIIAIGREIKLFRRNYVLRLDLKRSSGGVQAAVECEFELCNATDQKQPYVQEITVDDSDNGYVERMAFSVNGRSIYNLKRPAATEKPIGYASYRAPKQLIAPSTKGDTYFCTASWVIHRAENDIWYNHMALPTVGMKVETHAPSSFTITPPYSLPGLSMTGEHRDIAWRKRTPKASGRY